MDTLVLDRLADELAQLLRGVPDSSQRDALRGQFIASLDQRLSTSGETHLDLSPALLASYRETQKAIQAVLSFP